MPLAVLASSNFTDPEHERLIWLAVGGLVLLGVVLLVVTVLWWRATKGEHAALAPLEVMGDRAFVGLTHVEQSRRLDAVRLQLDGDVEPGAVVAEDAVDLDEVLRSFQPGFDDLRDERAAAPAAPADEAAATPRIAVALVGAASDDAPTPAADGPEPDVATSADVDDQAAADVVPVEAELDGADAITGEAGETGDGAGRASQEPAQPERDRRAAATAPSEPAADEWPVQPDAATDRHRNGINPGGVAREPDDESSGNGTEVRSTDPLLTGEPVES